MTIDYATQRCAFDDAAAVSCVSPSPESDVYVPYCAAHDRDAWAIAYRLRRRDARVGVRS